jgi:hypothetical protein
VTLSRSDGAGEPPVFTTDRAAEIPAGQTQVDVDAHHCDLVQGELAGLATGLPGFSVVARRPPIVAPTGAEGDLVVGVEARPGELGDRAPQITFDGKSYRVWTEADNFADAGPDDPLYVVDRVTGTITFAPAVQKSQDGSLTPLTQALAAVPAAGREVRLWYRRGGGPDGNVAANLLTVLKDPIAGVQVTNPAPATGGQAVEDLANAMVRGPQELHSLQRAVTAQDFEQIALARGVARAHAFTRAAFWVHAVPGTVEVLLVPRLSPAEGVGPVTAALLEQHQTDAVRSQVAKVLDERRPLGTTCLVNWAHYKTVHVSARIVVFREEDADAVKRRVLGALYQAISPLPTARNPAGWGFGQALHASDVYDVALREPGVHWIDRVKLLVDEVPDQAVLTVVADRFQPHTWHAGSAGVLFRSLDDGEGWESASAFPDGQISALRPHPERPGLLGLVVQLGDGKGSRLYTSADCAETWTFLVETAFVVQQIAWLDRDGLPMLLLATDVGFFEQTLEPGKGPVQVTVDPQAPNQGFYAVAVTREVRGVVSVAVAAQNLGGVYLSKDAGKSFQNSGLQNHDVRRLAVQYSGVQAFLWAGAFAAGPDAPGEGCFRWQLLGAENPQEGWQTWGTGWKGGSCLSITFAGSSVLCGSHHAGVLRIDPNSTNPQWQASDLRSGLPLRDTTQFTFEPVAAIAADPAGQLVMAGGQEGVFRSRDRGNTFEPSSRKEFPDQVTLPETWLFCSGEHDLRVVDEDEARRG